MVPRKKGSQGKKGGGVGSRLSKKGVASTYPWEGKFFHDDKGRQEESAGEGGREGVLSRTPCQGKGVNESTLEKNDKKEWTSREG